MQAQQFAHPKPKRQGEHGDEQLFRRPQKSSVDTQPDEPQAKDNGGHAERRTEENLRSDGQRFGHRQPQQRADQNAQGVEKCAGHTLTQRGARSKRKPENAQGGAVLKI